VKALVEFHGDILSSYYKCTLPVVVYKFISRLSSSLSERSRSNYSDTFFLALYPARLSVVVTK
jgi:hypothetical protein